MPRQPRGGGIGATAGGAAHPLGRLPVEEIPAAEGLLVGHEGAAAEGLRAAAAVAEDAAVSSTLFRSVCWSALGLGRVSPV
jgi:hypothetical protein